MFENFISNQNIDDRRGEEKKQDNYQNIGRTIIGGKEQKIKSKSDSLQRWSDGHFPKMWEPFWTSKQRYSNEVILLPDPRNY